MRRIPLVPVALAFSSLAGCAYDYAPAPPYHETTYSYSSPAPAYYDASPPPAATTRDSGRLQGKKRASRRLRKAFAIRTKLGLLSLTHGNLWS